MKFLTVLLVTLSAFCGFNRLSASPANDLEGYLSTTWTGNEEYLYFKIDLANELQFEDKYTTFEVTNGRGCKIAFKPIQKGTVFSSENGYELQKINLTVILENNEDPNKVAVTATTNSIYQGMNEEGFLSDYTYEAETTGFLSTPAIDLSQDPEFFTLDDEHSGVIAFTNAN